MYDQNVRKIEGTISTYFDGLFHGDIDKLTKAFDANCVLFGDINGESYRKPLEAYLEGVKNRKSPSELKETFNMEILAIEVLGLVAMVKLHVPMLGFNYYDFLSLTEIDGEWKIVNKLFVHVGNV